MKRSKVLAISDLHLPFHLKRAYDELLAHIEIIKPTHIVQVGDLLDQYIFSKYARTLGITAKDDVEYGLQIAHDMWAAIRVLAPKAECYQLLGNHDMRMAKRILEKMPEMCDFFSHKDLYKFEGVKVSESDRDFIEIDGVVYVHGWLSKSSDHIKHFGKPVVHGHRHRPAIEFLSKDLWSMDVGYMANAESLPMRYTASKHTKWTCAYGIVDNGKPQLVIL